ncbi:unnamed protein product [Blepharisma stoltei]|uniref:Uncharacterized protein n=1 Tax=Blepharisma stoltei TaxID=1481888 RepID=A0AAU9IMX1_9CILI|nr:unnamed protein product [Blepharisma stoltei]
MFSFLIKFYLSDNIKSSNKWNRISKGVALDYTAKMHGISFFKSKPPILGDWSFEELIIDFLQAKCIFKMPRKFKIF